MSVNLTGNKSKPALNSDGKASKHHVMLFTAHQVENHPEIGMSRPDLVFFALLAGGDYDKVSACSVERSSAMLITSIGRRAFWKIHCTRLGSVWIWGPALDGIRTPGAARHEELSH